MEQVKHGPVFILYYCCVKGRSTHTYTLIDVYPTMNLQEKSFGFSMAVLFNPNSTQKKITFLFNSKEVFTFRNIPSRVTTVNKLSLICTFGLSEILKLDVPPETTMYFIQAGDPDLGHLVATCCTQKKQILK